MLALTDIDKNVHQSMCAGFHKGRDDSLWFLVLYAWVEVYLFIIMFFWGLFHVATNYRPNRSVAPHSTHQINSFAIKILLMSIEIVIFQPWNEYKCVRLRMLQYYIAYVYIQHTIIMVCQINLISSIMYKFLKRHKFYLYPVTLLGM